MPEKAPGPPPLEFNNLDSKEYVIYMIKNFFPYIYKGKA
jgi:hypothetical protein